VSLMNEQEQAFFEWWQKVEPHKDHYNLRMAFDAGYERGRERDEQ
jgi:hypothetical protein